MSDPIDELLAQIQSSSNDPVSKQHSPMPSQPSGAGSIDDLLAEMEGQSIPPVRNVPAASPQKSSPSSPTPSPQPLPRQDTAMDSLLADMKSIYQEQDRAETLKQQQHQQEEQQRQATLKRQRQVVLIKQAEEWLKTLDPRGGEGAWFEEFAAKYPSRVEAAIEYLGLEG